LAVARRRQHGKERALITSFKVLKNIVNLRKSYCHLSISFQVEAENVIGQPHIVRTTRNSALPLSMRA
jgi:hypothetical protein